MCQSNGTRYGFPGYLSARFVTLKTLHRCSAAIAFPEGRILDESSPTMVGKPRTLIEQIDSMTLFLKGLSLASSPCPSKAIFEGIKQAVRKHSLNSNVPE
jgi:hypothetical protein